GPLRSLGHAATAVALSDTVVAALVDEAANGGRDLNGDGDSTDAVVAAGPVDGSLTNRGQAAKRLAVARRLLVFLTAQADQGRDLNGDHDQGDDVLQVYDAGAGRFLLGGDAGPAFAAEDFVVGGDPGGEFVAFRTSEASQGADLNGDDDRNDVVLQIFDP